MDRICVGEHTVQSRHLGGSGEDHECPSIVHLHIICIQQTLSDGFMSSLGCKDKERVGHLYRGRDCENNMVEDKLERMCYCRYHWCNHRDYYYGAGASLRAGAAVMAVAAAVLVLNA